MAVSSSAASSTQVASGPTQSSDDPYATRPERDTRPYVGLMPTTPQKCAGCRMLPPARRRREPGSERHAPAGAAPRLPRPPPWPAGRPASRRTGSSSNFSAGPAATGGACGAARELPAAPGGQPRRRWTVAGDGACADGRRPQARRCTGMRALCFKPSVLGSAGMGPYA